MNGTFYQTFIPSICIADANDDEKSEIVCGPGHSLAVVNYEDDRFSHVVLHIWEGFGHMAI